MSCEMSCENKPSTIKVVTTIKFEKIQQHIYFYDFLFVVFIFTQLFNERMYDFLSFQTIGLVHFTTFNLCICSYHFFCPLDSLCFIFLLILFGLPNCCFTNGAFRAFVHARREKSVQANIFSLTLLPFLREM